ncbi:MAG: hypothetical protein F6J96_01390 [Symploca sp. SIO1C2]|nr:hypothetical protein [Symploca sp. SIO1C2]NER50296.1 hypothetical protein [Symploca sp. SIO1A3]
MTRFIHDQFAKDYLEELLTPYGEVKAPRRVSGEVREIDVWFDPNFDSPPSNLRSLGLLGRMAQTPALIEPFRNAATADEICDCLLKLFVVRGELQREAHRNQLKLSRAKLPKLWILTPTASATLLGGLNAKVDQQWLPGVYFMAKILRTVIVVIHRLPRSQETLWLRVLGRGKVQQQAIDELEALPANNPLRFHTLRLLYNLRKNLEFRQDLDEGDRKLIMHLAPLYQQEREQVLQQGVQQGERLVVNNLLQVRFGDVDEELGAIIEPLLALPPEEFTPMLLQLSREELLARFRKSN